VSMGHGWFVTVGRWGDPIVTIEEHCLSGKDITPEDAELIRACAEHLLAFVGRDDQHEADVLDARRLMRLEPPAWQ
jgi:hypothetical protein